MLALIISHHATIVGLTFIRVQNRVSIDVVHLEKLLLLMMVITLILLIDQNVMTFNLGQALMQTANFLADLLSLLFLTLKTIG